MKFISCATGLGGQFRGKGWSRSCPLCLVLNTELYKQTAPTLRTTRDSFHLAHQPYPGDTTPFPFTCPSPDCRKTFTSQEQCDSDMSADSTKYAKAHYNMHHHEPPIFNIPIANYIVCTLHLLLSIMKTLFHELIRCNVQNDDVSEKIGKALKRMGVNAKKIQPMTRSGVKAGRPQTFIGVECLRILHDFDVLLAIVNNNVQDDEWSKQ